MYTNKPKNYAKRKQDIHERGGQHERTLYKLHERNRHHAKGRKKEAKNTQQTQLPTLSNHSTTHKKHAKKKQDINERQQQCKRTIYEFNAKKSRVDSGGNTSTNTNKAINRIGEAPETSLFASIIIMASLPGDPRDDLFIKLDQEDMKGSVENGILRMNLLDYILHATSMIIRNNDSMNYCHGCTTIQQRPKNQRSMTSCMVIGRVSTKANTGWLFQIL